jgi:hypothetical protein
MLSTEPFFRSLLEDDGQISLTKWKGDQHYPRGDSPDRTFFHEGQFGIQIASQGRKYFEELEQRAELENQRPLVFISCGQYHPKEVQLGKDLATQVDELTQLEGYFAENRNTLAGLSNDIFRALEQCSAFVAVMHHRGEVETLEHQKHIRGSIWVEQEIAIAAFLTATRNRDIPVLLYTERGIKREGVREQLKLNPVEFDEEAEVLADFVRRLKSGTFPNIPRQTAVEKAKRTVAQQHHYDTAKSALQKLGPIAETALRHLKTHQPLTFGMYDPLLPVGMNHDQAMNIYQLCAAEGLVTQRDALKPGYAERVFEIAPTMNEVLDELLYETIK